MLATWREHRYHPFMVGLSRFSRLLVALAALCVLYAGPVAACVCAMDAVSTMPCCPDQAPDDSDCALPDADVGAACAPVSADALTSVAFDHVSSPAVAPTPVLLWNASRGPPTVPIPARDVASHAAPIYLVTLRLRN